MKPLICITLAAFFFSTSALADEPNGESSACHDDFQKYCKDVKPGGGRIMRCMAKHKADLSGDCVEFLKQKRQEHQEMRKEKKEEQNSGSSNQGSDSSY